MFGHQWLASEGPFKWRYCQAHGAFSGTYLPSSALDRKKQVVRVGLPLTKNFLDPCMH